MGFNSAFKGLTDNEGDGTVSSCMTFSLLFNKQGHI